MASPGAILEGNPVKISCQLGTDLADLEHGKRDVYSGGQGIGNLSGTGISKMQWLSDRMDASSL